MTGITLVMLKSVDSSNTVTCTTDGRFRSSESLNPIMTKSNPRVSESEELNFDKTSLFPRAVQNIIKYTTISVVSTLIVNSSSGKAPLSRRLTRKPPKNEMQPNNHPKFEYSQTCVP